MTTGETPRRRLLMVMPYQQLARKAGEAGFDVWSIWDPAMQTSDYLDQVRANSVELLLTDLSDHRGLAELIEVTAEKHRIELVLCLGNEDIQLATAVAAAELGLGTNPPETVRRINDKSAMRALLNEHGHSPVSARKVTDAADVAEAAHRLGLPVIVKPAELSGSRGVALVRDDADLAAWLDRAAQPGLPGPYVVEEYLRGPEFSVETLTVGGEHHVIGVTRKHTTGAPGFVETGHVFPAPVGEAEARALAETATGLLDLAGYRFGPAHTEIVLTGTGPRVVESQTRLGGDRIPALIGVAAGFDIEAEVFRALAGREVPAVRPTGVGAIGFLGYAPGVVAAVSPRLEEARSLPYVDTLHFPFAAGDELPVIRDSFTRHGYVVVAADTAELAAERIETVRAMAEPVLVPNPADGTADGRTVLLVGGTDGHVTAFDRLGARIVLAQHPDKVTAHQTRTAHALLMVDYTDWETLLPFARAAQQVYGCEVVASLTEGGLTPAARLADLFGLGDGRRHEVSRRMRDKQLMREHLAAAAVGPEVLAAEVTDGESLTRFGERAGYPFVVKPTGTTAGFGVAKVRDRADVERVRGHIERLRGARTDRGSTLFRVTGFLAEEYLDGAEFSVEAFTFAGSHRVLAVTEKLVDDGHFAELGHALPARLPSDDHARVVAAVEDHLTAMGVVEGPSHTEVRLGDRGPVVIESHNRMGGDFIIELLAAATGIDLPAWSAARALGVMEEPADLPAPFGGACVRFLTGGDGVVAAVHGADDVAALPEVITSAVSVVPGSRTRRPRDNWDRLGHVAVRAPDTDTAVARCEQLAHREIRIETR